MSKHPQNLVVGDVQGCRAELEALLSAASFDPRRDQLWLLGDLVNRGPESLATLRLLRELGPCVNMVLGNHDLHLLACLYGGHQLNRKDTMAEVLRAPDVEQLGHWLRQQPLAIELPAFNTLLVHAGVPHIWSDTDALSYAREVEAIIGGSGHTRYFRAMYGNQPAGWSSTHRGMDRWRAITNYLTRMRLIAEDGTLEFSHKGEPRDLPPGFQPWFSFPRPAGSRRRIAFGHWAALNGQSDQPWAWPLDTGCVWGRTLTGRRLEDGRTFTLPAGAALRTASRPS